MSRALATRTPPALPADYIPGAVRRTTDHEHAAVETFVARHPECPALGPNQQDVG